MKYLWNNVNGCRHTWTGDIVDCVRICQLCRVVYSWHRPPSLYLQWTLPALSLYFQACYDHWCLLYYKKCTCYSRASVLIITYKNNWSVLSDRCNFLAKKTWHIRQRFWSIACFSLVFHNSLFNMHTRPALGYDTVRWVSDISYNYTMLFTIIIICYYRVSIQLAYSFRPVEAASCMPKIYTSLLLDWRTRTCILLGTEF